MKFHKPEIYMDYYTGYESAMSRRRPESVIEEDRFYHYLYENESIRVYQERKGQQVSAIIGQISPAFLDGEKLEIFKASHFSPLTMREGLKLLKKMAKEKNRVIIFTVTEDLKDMLIGCGFSPVGISFEMEWNGESHSKHVFTQLGMESIVKLLINDYCDF